MTLLDELTRLAEIEFSAIVTGAQAIEPKRRIFLSDGSFVDVWVSLRLPDRFGFHWERRHLDGTTYRYDNFPDIAWRTVPTFPYHFHDGSDSHVVSAPFQPRRRWIAGFPGPEGILTCFRQFGHSHRTRECCPTAESPRPPVA